MSTGLPPPDSACEPEATGSALIPVPAAPPTEKKLSGLSEILYRTLSPPPQYSYVSSHLPSEVGTTVVMPGRPPPICVCPDDEVNVVPATSSTGVLHEEDVRPFHVRCARICAPESARVSLSAASIGTPVVVL